MAPIIQLVFQVITLINLVPPFLSFYPRITPSWVLCT